MFLIFLFMKQQYRGGAKIVDKKAKAKIKYFGNATLPFYMKIGLIVKRKLVR